MTHLMTAEALEAYDRNFKAKAKRAARLGERKAEAMRRLILASDFVAHRYATAYFEIAAERRDHQFQMDTWGYDAGQQGRRAALGLHLNVLRQQANEARAARRAAA